MKWLLVLCLCLIVYTLADDNDGRDPDRSHYRGISTSKFNYKDNVNIENKSFVQHFISMPYEIKRMILGYLTENELYAFMHIDEVAEYHQMAAEAYGVSYGNSPIFMKDLSLDDSINFLYNNRALSFNNVTIFVDFLKTFHKYIKNIKLDLSSLDSAGEKRSIFAAIGQHCGDTLKRLEIRNDKEKINGIGILAGMSFPNVEELSFYFCNWKLQNLNLKKAFPNVRRLSTTFGIFVDRMWVDNSFSDLTHLQIHTGRREFTDDEVLRILSKNPTIHSLSLAQATPNLMRTINEQFPNIINLGFISMQPIWKTNYADVHMNNVKRLVYEGAIPAENLHFLHFDNLKEIQWHSSSNADALLIKFIQKHKHSLEIIQIVESIITDKHLEQLKDMPVLEKLGIWNATFNANSLINFIESNKQLSEVRLFNVPEGLKTDLYNAFNANDVPASLKEFVPKSNEEGDLYLAKSDGNPTKWGNTLEFLWDNFF